MNAQANTTLIDPATAPRRQAGEFRRRRALVLVTVGLLLGLSAFGVWRERFQTYHLATVTPGVLYRDGNRGLREFENAVRQSGAKTIVSLIDDRELAAADKSQFKHEADFLARSGIRLERIPVKLGGWPTAADVAKFLSVVEDKRSQPVLVHCAQGVRRTGMMVAAYQKSELKLTDEQAKSAILTFGHSRRTVGDVERFIDGYDPAVGSVPILADSDE